MFYKNDPEKKITKWPGCYGGLRMGVQEAERFVCGGVVVVAVVLVMVVERW